jgi:hypothetical protein
MLIASGGPNPEDMLTVLSLSGAWQKREGHAKGVPDA